LIQIIPVRISADVRPRDDLGVLVIEAIKQNQAEICDGDVLVVAQKIVSKAEGRIVDLGKVKPSRKAIRMAKEHAKDPRVMELILQESMQILRAKKGIVVSETRHGFVCANAGIDQSNVQGDVAVLLPVDPDRSASRLRDAIKRKAGKDVAVVITDTFGRTFREGQTNVAIGIAGIKPIKSYIGSRDMYGRKLKVTEIAIVDEIASATELVMGKAKGVPVVIVRGLEFEKAAKSSIKPLIRPKENDLFR
jgi:coenzyme F420-0:L-glutamate ligase / coenzyme F420-1:gamma-L-glutamate ligase